MTIYHINKGIGRASSGIEYAQKYRYELVKAFPERQFFVFCDYLATNITVFTDRMGFDIDDVLNAYKFMAGQKNHRSTYTVDEFVETIPESFEKTEETSRFVLFQYDKTQYKVWLLPDNGMVDRIDTIFNGKLMEVGRYSDRLTATDFYTGVAVSARHFYDEAGNLSMRQFYENGEITLTMIDTLVLQGRNAFYQEFFKRLNFTAEDLILVDRNKDIGDALYLNKGKAKTCVVIHAEHYNEARTTDDWVGWNNFYEYPFVNAQWIDHFIVSTYKQEEILRKQMALMGHPDVDVLTIPVGAISHISDGANVEKNKYKFMTASRLAFEKHIDISIKAVVKAKESVPELEFHIYGEGKFRKDLADLIKKYKADDYIILEGHKNLAEIYPQFGGYLTASGSEGFGLTILEAIAEMLPIVGLKVNYGNTEFVKTGVNGILVEKNDPKTQVKEIAAAIVKQVNTLDYQANIAYSSEKAAGYTNEVVQAKWRALYDTVALAENGGEL
ncbi:glycosyltransferase Gtf1 [Lactococcus hodotermopsidis]|uniref:Glycosyltransferase Gtf1 n=1 Tax=Pseudolactococcus hodotermopsidis TaxID=2709157 RepID=A0A6A0BCB3_9LACT|nr:glycosyltransferase [Lactococcus hodotermopsidis]GFH43002.1 glycosyltransferase Gtf1 [Lactococcus hodotermopsidis]